jgi:hypothetical protein
VGLDLLRLISAHTLAVLFLHLLTAQQHFFYFGAKFRKKNQKIEGTRIQIWWKKIQKKFVQIWQIFFFQKQIEYYDKIFL